MYEYRATILDVVDGGTVRAEVDLGCDASIRLTIRLAAINAPEPYVDGELNEPGIDARQHLIELLRPRECLRVAPTRCEAVDGERPA